MGFWTTRESRRLTAQKWLTGLVGDDHVLFLFRSRGAAGSAAETESLKFMTD
jgi:hypothetical protein